MKEEYDLSDYAADHPLHDQTNKNVIGKIIKTIVERFNRTLAEWLFGYQYAKKMENPNKCNT